MRFKDVKAYITGGQSGLGKATAEFIKEKGGKVAVIDLKKNYNEFSIIDASSNNLKIFANVTEEDEVRKSFEAAFEHFSSINLVVNCAGIGVAEKLIGKNGLHSIDLFQKVINVNLFGTFNVIREASNWMQNNVVDDNKMRGVIINTSSIAAYDGQIGQAAYSASKGAVVSLTLPLARELAKYGIRVCTIAPGLFETPMLAGLPEKAYQNLINNTLLPKRLGNPSEFAKLVKAIYENDMLNGETIRLDGSIRLAPK